MIKLDNVSKYYVGNNEIALGLRKINLEFTIGEMVAITGESGSGKSTLLNVLSGSDTYEEGELYIDGKPTSYYDESDWEQYRRENIGFVYQSYNLIDSYTVFENINTALLIKGDVGDNTEKVMSYLDKVGLREHAKKKATQLSSGQKQRLAIARALAKETDIIVADEPTGNLDSENSAEIIKLLHSIAEDKLIFVVTHNYDEIEPYATRKIRMYDGEVAEDIVLREKRISHKAVKKKEEIAETRNFAEKKGNRERVKHIKGKANNNKQKEIKKRMVRKLDRLNRKNKPVTFAFLLSFMVAIAAAFYILLGSFFSNLDNTTSKVFDSTRFDNKDITRLIVMKEDGSVFSDDDVEVINEISKVNQVDKYDNLSDTFYLLKENEDYKYIYNMRTRITEEPTHKKPWVLTGDTYMKSVTCIDENDLAAGTMPKNIYDIAVYSDDESIIGSTIHMYLGNRLLWANDLAEIECTVTAILKEETEQIYFSEKLAQMLLADPNKYNDYLSENDEGFVAADKFSLASVQIMMDLENQVEEPAILVPDIDEDNYEAEFEEYLNGTFHAAAPRPIFIVNEELTGNEAIVSEHFVALSYIQDDKGIIYPHDFYNIASFGVTNDEYDSQIDVLESDLMRELEVIQYYKDNREEIIAEISSDDYELELSRAQEQYNKILAEYNEVSALKQTHRSALVLQQETSLSSSNVIEVSEEFFEREIGYKQSTQMAVYIDDYAYADKVLNSLKSKGYVAASVYRIGAVEYDLELVERKATSMFISLGAFIAIFFIGVFILGMIMRLGERDFKILKLLGIEGNELNSINKTGIILNMIMAVILSFFIIFILYIIKISYVVNIVKYYRWYFYLIYAVAVAAFCTLLYVRSKARVSKLNKK